ncbi:MAG: gamma-glutamylcyclotransferase [Pseudomonadales bacterium]|nr:gamma-glutamylcyclotransferase [Pseudomonadales bacterium]MBO7007973.1 gamma-glutamylcyclotransferase [Pseudomonadales bacterium]
MWIFGYGSLIWKTGFTFESREPAFINGWQRRFCQASPDHRGTPEFPGRVVTLIQAPGEQCHGIAYRLPSDQLEEIIEELDYREKNGYERLAIDIHFRDRTELGFVYHADEQNPSFVREESPFEIANRISQSHGPSGSNIEYVLELQKALREQQIIDSHVTELADLISGQAFEPPSTE